MNIYQLGQLTGACLHFMIELIALQIFHSNKTILYFAYMLGPGAEENITVDIATQLPESTTYEANLVIISNDPESPEVHIPIHLDVNTSLGEHVEIPNQFKFYQNYPNPFNPSTTISYALPQEADVSITIYDILGGEVLTYEVISQPAGYYSLQWDGLDKSDQQVASGVYLISLTTSDFKSIIKAVLIR